jgi:hypothetical protein
VVICGEFPTVPPANSLDILWGIMWFHDPERKPMTSRRDLMTSRRDLTEGHLVRNIIYLSWPIVVSALLQTTVGIVDIMMVGVLGPQPLAAVGMARFILMVVLANLYHHL